MPEQDWKPSDIIEATHGVPLTHVTKPSFAGIGIDSRQISNNMLFVAIRGRMHDGHRFVSDVVEQGVKGILIEHASARELSLTRLESQGVVCIGVKDTTVALGDLAAFHRRRSPCRIVAITGSNGKTSTRAMTASLLALAFSTLSTRGNRNNEIGLPLTLLELDAHHEWAVLELGMNHPGEIGRLGHICSPDIGVITNIGPVHLAGVGSIEGVMQAKAELLSTMRPGGNVVLNADDPMSPRLESRSLSAVCRFGFAASAHVRGSGLVQKTDGLHFRLHLPDGDVAVRITAAGSFMAANAMAAATVAHLTGMTPADIRTGLERFTPEPGRMAVSHSRDGLHLIDDSYNANPVSMKKALESLRQLSADGRSLAILGDMLELGPASAELHHDVGRSAARLGIKRLFVAGQFAEDVAAGAREGGMPETHIWVGAKKDLPHQLFEVLAPGDWLLVKGSRGMQMETVVNAVRERFWR